MLRSLKGQFRAYLEANGYDTSLMGLGEGSEAWSAGEKDRVEAAYEKAAT
jgi:hypothetical protein